MKKMLLLLGTSFALLLAGCTNENQNPVEQNQNPIQGLVAYYPFNGNADLTPKSATKS